jgi:hypothetical protein
MTVAYVDAGAVVKQSGNSSPAPVPFPTTTTNLNLLVLVALSGSTGNAAPTTPTGWTLIDSVLGTSGTYSTTDGPRRCSTYWKIADGTEGGGTESVSWDSASGGGAAFAGQIHQFSKTLANWETPVAADGEDTTSASGTAAFSAVTGALSLDVGDMVFVAPACAGDTTLASPAMAATGITFGTITERPGADNNTRITWLFWEASVTAGTASGAVTLTLDVLADPTIGVAQAIRLRESAGGGIDLVAAQSVDVGDSSTSQLTMAGAASQAVDVGDAASVRGLDGSDYQPVSDVTVGNWYPSTGSNLYATIDEAVASDTDYDYTNEAGGPDMEVALASMADPATDYDHLIKYRIRADSGGMLVTLKQGATTIASWAHTTVPAVFTTFTRTLSTAEAASITNYADLRLTFGATL